jgi:beta-phosphoglucomutase-like phosphatase (HAD superfamily)
MEHLVVKPSECLIIEDNENGIKAARASGGHLLVAKEVKEVNLNNILMRIREIESGVTK